MTLFAAITPSDVYARQEEMFLLMRFKLVLHAFTALLIVALAALLIWFLVCKLRPVMNAVLDMAKSYRELSDSINKDTRRAHADMLEKAAETKAAVTEIKAAVDEVKVDSGKIPIPAHVLAQKREGK